MKTLNDIEKMLLVMLVAFKQDVRAEGMFDFIIKLGIALIIIAALIPTAVTTIFGANTSVWDAPTIAIWGLVPVIAVIAIVMKIWNEAKRKG